MSPQSFSRKFPHMVVMEVLISFVILFSPLQGDKTEAFVIFCFGFYLISLMVIYLPCYGLSFMWRNEKPDRKFTVQMMTLFVSGTFLVYFPGIVRVKHAELLRTEFNGVVIGNYRSNNHQQQAVQIKTESGQTIDIEGIADAWVVMQPGVKVHKKPWSQFVEVNGKRVRFVHRGALDSLRGLSEDK